MKNKVANLWKQTRWTLAAAGSLGLAMQASAQSPYSPASKPAFKSIDAGPRPWREERSNRDIEIKTELAWLANPSLFPYPLKARVTGSVLEVTGILPTATLHAQALRIARDECGITVKDEITINAGVAVPPTTRPAQVLSRDVNDALADALPTFLDAITTNVWMRGQVVLKGTVATGEDKLEASRCLRRVAGCSCVVNQLQVARPLAAKPMPGTRDQSRKVESPVPQWTVKPEHVSVYAPQSLRLDAPFTQNSKPIVPAQQQAVQTTSFVNSQPATSTTYAAPVVRADMTQSSQKQTSSPLAFHATKWRRLDADSSIWTPKLASSPYQVMASSLPSTPAIIQAAASLPQTPNGSATVKQAVATAPLPEVNIGAAQAHETRVGDGVIFFDDTEKPLAQLKKDK